MFSKRNPVVNRILVVIDGDNLFSNVIADARHYSLAKGLERLIKQLTQVGEVVGVFVFGPPDLINRNLGALQNEGFWPIPCQRETDKQGESVDVVDGKIIAFVRDMLELMPFLTHICIGSGDSDFIPLARTCRLRRKKVIVVSGNLRSLSQDLKNMADKHPQTGERMVFLFSPTP